MVGNAEHRFLTLEQLRELKLDPTAVLLEPAGRNTAPALTLAALQATEAGADPVLVVTPADQTVADGAAFTAALQQAVRQAAGGAIVILGITPDRPETGYGYIRSAQPAGEDGVQQVAQFVEKPDAGHRRPLPGRRQLQLEQRHVRGARFRVAEGLEATSGPTSSAATQRFLGCAQGRRPSSSARAKSRI